jgi:hypothetical protein
LVAKVDRRDRGPRQTGPQAFDWLLTPDGWDNVLFLAEPLCTHPGDGHQLIDWTGWGDARVLLSPDGDW